MFFLIGQWHIWLDTKNNEYRDCNTIQFAPENYDHQKVCAESHKELVWLTNQFEPAKEMFGKYLFIGR